MSAVAPSVWEDWIDVCAVDDITPGQMRKLIDINYMGTYLATRAALPVFRRQRHGHLVIVSSIDQPTIIRENRSSTTARYSQPSAVGM